jgi:uncharacterized protein YndB with AHSA1/START domain
MPSFKAFSSAFFSMLGAGALLVTPQAQAAQVESSAQIIIKAPIEEVWRLISNVKAWPRWNPAVDSVELSGDIAPGNSFVWKSKGFNVISTFAQIEPLKRLTWNGSAIGTKAFHEWEFEVTDAGVIVRTHETFDGWLPWLLKGTMQQTLDDTLPRWLETLKATAERPEKSD